MNAFPDLHDEQLERKIATAAAGYETWKKIRYAKRASIVAKAGRRVRENADRFAKYAAVEMGKFTKEFRGEVTETHHEDLM